MDNQLIETLARNQELLTQLVASNGDHSKTVGSVQSAAWLHGSLGMFAVPGLEREIISTHVRSYGLVSKLPRYPSVYESPFFGALTGFSDDVGSEPATPCADAPTGYQKACNLTAQFGRVARDTETIEMDKVMLKLHRGDHTDLRLMGSVLGLGDLDPGGLNEQQIVDLVTMSQMVNVAVRMERVICGHTWTGSPANNNVGGGYKEFPGLDNQIATGQVDATTNTSCPSLDSDIKDFNYNDVCGTTLDIVEYMSALEYFIHSLATDTGLMPVQWVWVMRPQLWYELSACWPCKYNTNRCLSTPNIGESVVRLDGRENISDRDNMRRSMTIDVNGRTYPVILDNCISEDSNQTTGNLAAGTFASDIYFVPLTITGGFPVTYLEYLDYRQAASDTALLRGREDFWTDRGIYSWAIENLNWCYKLKLKTEMRVVLRTPQLAGRIQNVMYSPLQHLREDEPTSPYFVDGGVSIRIADTKYAAWL